MECIFPPELDEKSLWTYLDEEADQDMARHLEQCDYCRARAKGLERLRDQVRSRVYRVACPPALELGEYYLRLLPANQSLTVAGHVRECKHCAKELAQLETFLKDETSTSGAGPFRTLIARLKGAMSSTGSPLSSGAVALRGEKKGPITLEADGIVITLDIQPGPNGLASILGQVAAQDQDNWTGAAVELRQTDAPQLTASLDDLGSFSFEAVRPGSIQITITSLHGAIVQIPNIDVTL